MLTAPENVDASSGTPSFGLFLMAVAAVVALYAWVTRKTPSGSFWSRFGAGRATRLSLALAAIFFALGAYVAIRGGMDS